MLVITPFLKLLNQLKIYHWQTKSYAEHKAFGKAYDSLDGLVDQFVEVYMGKYGVPKARLKFDVEADNYDENHVQFVKDSIQAVVGMRNELSSDTDTELQNILDEMTAELERLLYLLSLK